MKAATAHKYRIALLLAGISSLAAIGTPSWAAEAAAKESATELEQITVTATRREEALSKVPLSVTAISGKQIAQDKITNFRDVVLQVPGLHFSPIKGDSTTSIYIRGQGIGSQQSVGLDTPVAFFIDDIYYGTAASFSSDFYDVSQIAVLKGPQGTTFGRNVVGGAVQITTARPEMRTDGGYVNATVENYYGFETWGYVNHAFSDDLAGRLSISSRNRRGFIRNVKTGNYANDLHTLNGRAQLRWQPSDTLDANLAVSWNHVDQASPIYDYIGTSAMVLAYRAATGNDPRKAVANQDLPNRRDNGQVVLHINWQTPYGEVQSITGAHRMHSFYQQYADNVLPTTAYVGVSGAVNRERAFSQEFRLVSPADRKFTYVAGIYGEISREFVFLDLSYDVGGANLNNFVNTLITGGLDRVDDNPANPANYAPAAIYGAGRLKPFAPGTTRFVPAYADQTVKLKTIAGYFEGSYHLLDALTLTGGVRYTITHKTGYTEHVPGNAFYGVFGFSQNYSHTWYQMTPRVIAQFQATPDFMVYASASNGVKSGGFSFTALTPQAVAEGLAPENSWSYEGGFKGYLLDHRLYLSSAVYKAITKNLQTRVLSGGAFVEKNAGRIKVKGAEAQADFRPTENLTIGARGAYTDARFADFKNCTSAGADCSGNRIPAIPKWDGLAYANVNVPLAQDNGALLFKASVHYSSKVVLDGTGFTNSIVLGNAKTGVKGVIDTSVTYTPARGAWTLQLWAKNLTNKLYVLSGQNYYFFADTKAEFANPANRDQDAVTYAPPRTFGATFDYKF